MNTLIQNINSLMEIKKDLNQVLVDNGALGGPIFDEYPDQFRELFRVLEDTINDIEEGPYATIETQKVVAKPDIKCVDNVVTITCLTNGAQIYYMTDSQGWTPYYLSFYISRDTYVEAYAVLNGIYSSNYSTICYYTKPSNIEPPTIERNAGVVTMSHPNPNAAIWYRIITDNTWTRYEGPVNIPSDKTIEAYASYLNWGSDMVISEGRPEVPVISCTANVVTIICSTTGATIYYSTTSSTGSWIQYTGPITITQDTTFWAYSRKGQQESDVSAGYLAEYEEEPIIVPDIPEISCSANVVTITCSTSGATIYYSTTSDSGPWTEYTEAITISEDTSFWAYSELDNVSSEVSDEYEAHYEAAPVVRPIKPVIRCKANIVTMSVVTSGATIYYSTTSNTIGVGDWYTYTNGIVIEENTTFYAYSEKDDVTSDGCTTFNAVYDESYYYNNRNLTFQILQDGTIGWKTQGTNNNPKTIKYRKNEEGEWTEITSSMSGVTINVSAGDIVEFKGSNYLYGASTIDYCNSFTSTCAFNISGNIMSIVSENDFYNVNYLYSNNALAGLFYGIEHMIDASHLLLPATNISKYCYKCMFEDAFNSILYIQNKNGTITPIYPKVPSLVATTMKEGCYMRMFASNVNLITPPSLSATTLAAYCYQEMFAGCTYMTSVPTLSATTLAVGCYMGMFENCSSITSTPSLSATSLEENCYAVMFANCTSLTTAPSLPAYGLANYCYQSMFAGCTSLVNVPTLRTAASQGCFNSMFKGCTELRSIQLTGTVSAPYSHEYMFYGCTKLAYVKCKNTVFRSNWDSFKDWLYGVSSSGIFVKTTDTEWPTGISGIPSNWTVQEEASE